jgi:hypothetical protein
VRSTRCVHVWDAVGHRASAAKRKSVWRCRRTSSRIDFWCDRPAHLCLDAQALACPLPSADLLMMLGARPYVWCAGAGFNQCARDGHQYRWAGRHRVARHDKHHVFLSPTGGTLWPLRVYLACCACGEGPPSRSALPAAPTGGMKTCELPSTLLTALTDTPDSAVGCGGWRDMRSSWRDHASKPW